MQPLAPARPQTGLMLTPLTHNPRRMFLGWVRTVAPQVYAQALRQATGATRSLGGLTRNIGDLGQDDLQTVTVYGMGDETEYNPGDYSSPTFLPTLTEADLQSPSIDGTSLADVSLSPDVISAVNAAADSSDSSGSSSMWSSLITGISNIATTALKTSSTSSAQNQLLQLNATRAAQGLPPVNAAGQVISAVPAGSGAIQKLEASLGGSGGMGSILLIGGIGLAAYLFLRKRA